MQQLIDCTMLCTHTTRSWADRWFERMTDDKLRIRMVDVADGTGAAGLGTMLDAMRTHLHGSHLCLLPVCAENVSWVRMLLSQASGRLPVPVMAVTHGLKAAALRDLLALGVADFIYAPSCCDELRVRVERVLAQARTEQLDTLSRVLGTAPHPVGSKVAERQPYRQYAARADSGTDRTDDDVRSEVTDSATGQARCGKTVRTYAMGRLVQRASHKVAEMRFPYRQPVCTPHRDVAPQRGFTVYNALELEMFAIRCALQDEPFKQAKGRVVEGFEKAYLSAALDRYRGNIAQAARAAQKHRRAFWELVRKHHIDLTQYRVQG